VLNLGPFNMQLNGYRKPSCPEMAIKCEFHLSAMGQSWLGSADNH